MEPLDKDLFLTGLDQFGYSLARPANVDPVPLLVNMVESKDARILEGLPVVLTNVLRRHPDLEMQTVENLVAKNLQRRFRLLVAVTYVFLFWVPESDMARQSLLTYLREREPSLLADVQEKLNQKVELPAGSGARLDPARLEKTYKNYVVQEMMSRQESLAKQLEEKRQAAFNDALNELFTAKQKGLLFKVLNHELLTKTEREYYSRTVKPRLRALKNEDLQSLAATLLSM